MFFWKPSEDDLSNRNVRELPAKKIKENCHSQMLTSTTRGKPPEKQPHISFTTEEVELKSCQISLAQAWTEVLSPKEGRIPVTQIQIQIQQNSWGEIKFLVNSLPLKKPKVWKRHEWAEESIALRNTASWLQHTILKIYSFLCTLFCLPSSHLWKG